MTAEQDESYISIATEAVWECTIKRSRFIGIATPITTEADANRFLERMQSQYPAARHYVYAWRTNYPYLIQKYSDDAEPQGTAGRPTLEVLEKSGVDRGAICVVRYFGGVLLGSGGLLRAYSQTASAALNSAGIVKHELYHLFSVEVDYSVYERLVARLESAGFHQADVEFASRVKLTIGSNARRIAELHSLIQDQTAGSAKLIKTGERYLPVSLIK